MDLWTFSLPLLIFMVEVCVVTLGTLRIIFVARGHKLVAPVLGFFEILSWLFAVGVTMRHLDQWACCVAFAIGFTLGSYLGILIEKKLALGTVNVHVITHRDPAALIEQLRAANFGVTCIEGQGATGPVEIVMTVVKRRQLPEVLGLIETHHPGAFFAVDDLQLASEGIFPAAKERPGIFPGPISDMVQSLMPQKPVSPGHDQAKGRTGEPGKSESAALR